MKDSCTVINKSAGMVIYSIKEDNIRREFAPRERKVNISVNELVKLSQRPGGREILYNYLLIDDPEIAAYVINGEIAPEYWLTEDKIKTWINTCSLDEFKDAIDFAPEGTKDLIKKYSVSVPLADFAKRQALKEMTGYDVTKILENIQLDKSEVAAPAAKATQRRVAVPTSTVEEPKPVRRVTVDK